VADSLDEAKAAFRAGVAVSRYPEGTGDERGANQTLRAHSGFDPKLLDDRPPFLGIGLYQRAECLRCLSFAWKKLVPEIEKPRSYPGIGQRLYGRCIELTNNPKSVSSPISGGRF
jgi:hypothetical protein